MTDRTYPSSRPRSNYNRYQPSQRTERRASTVATRKDGGIPEKVYVPYRALAMLAFTIALVLGMFALLRANSRPEADIDRLSHSSINPALHPVASATSSTTPVAVDRSNINVCVFNAGKQAGLGARVVGVLKRAKFNVVGEAQNMDHPPTRHTTVFYPANHQAQAKMVSRFVRGSIVEPRNAHITECPGNIVVLLV